MRVGLVVWAAAGLALAPRPTAAQGSPEDSARAATDTAAASDTARRRVPKADSILLSYHPDTTKVKAPLAGGPELSLES
jgi:hypothetical protein